MILSNNQRGCLTWIKRGMLLSCLRTTRLLGSLAIRWKEPTHMSTISSMYTPSYMYKGDLNDVFTNDDPLPHA